ncbi:hypothetical protein BDZ45DRAFT_746205 [Acephala macrosclerotiorum]|nr:hypothetical protein BDZ45DRAFT_746205 [Acephala macrosclerotiorum]
MNSFFTNLKSKDKQRLPKDFDAFERDIAPTMGQQRYFREFHTMTERTQKTQQKFEGLNLPDTSLALGDDLVTRTVDKLEGAINATFDQFELHQENFKEFEQKKRRQIWNAISKVIPAVNDRMVALEVKISSEVKDLQGDEELAESSADTTELEALRQEKAVWAVEDKGRGLKKDFNHFKFTHPKTNAEFERVKQAKENVVRERDAAI